MKKIIPIWNSDGSCAEESENKTFCMAPWSHTYISPQGERRLCCASREEHSFQKQYIDATNDKRYEIPLPENSSYSFNPVSLKEHWNSSYMCDIRKKLIAGEKIPQCDVCNNEILSLNPYKDWFNGIFKHKIQEAFDSTDETGRTSMPVISFDYRYSNICNFKCRMCGEQLSSAWEAEKYKHNMWNEENQLFMRPDVRKKIKKFEIEVLKPEFKDIISKGTVEEIYWVGGEPLLYDVHWWALEEMINNGSAKNCYLRYNSNLSRIKYKGKYLYDYLPQFKNWLMCASIDGTGDIGEFIRKGLVWDKWLHNFKEGLKITEPYPEAGHDKMRIDLTITGPGIFSIKDLFDLSIELDVGIETKIMFAFHPDIVFSAFSWPRHILDRKIDELLTYIEPRVTQKQITLVNTLKEIKKRPVFSEEWPDTYQEAKKQGKAYQQQLDKIRNEKITIADIYKEDTELYDWWMND